MEHPNTAVIQAKYTELHPPGYMNQVYGVMQEYILVIQVEYTDQGTLYFLSIFPAQSQ